MKHLDLTHIIRKQHLPLLITLSLCFIAVSILYITNPSTDLVYHIGEDRIETLDDMYTLNHRQISITLDNLYYSGIDYKTDNTVKARVYYKLDHGRCYFIMLDAHRLPEDFKHIDRIDIKANLESRPEILDTVSSKLSTSLDFAQHSLEKLVFPYIINEYSYRHNFLKFMKYLSLSLAAILLFNLIYCIAIIIFPYHTHRLFYLRKYGSIKAQYNLAKKEFDDNPILVGHKIFITKSFIIVFSKTTTEIIPIDSIVWIYNYHEFRKRRRDSLMFSPMCIVTDTKKVHKISNVSQRMYNAIINIVCENNPQIMIGNDATHM